MIRTFILAVQTAPANNAGMNLWDMVVMGGWLMIPIFILSVIIIYIACERFWLIRKTGLTDVPFMEKIQEILKTAEENNKIRYYDKLSFPSSEKNFMDVFFIDRTEEYLVSLKMKEHQTSLEALNRRYELVLGATRLIPWTWDLLSKTINYDITYVTHKLCKTKNSRMMTERDGDMLVHPRSIHNYTL